MQKWIFVFIFCLSSFAFASEPGSGFVSLRGGLSTGSATYQSSSDSLDGWNADFVLGWRPALWLRLGLLGEFENNTFTNSSGLIGPMTLWGYGGQARLYFWRRIFIEGQGGETEARLAVNSTGNTLVATGTFYEVGPGLEIPTDTNFSLELGIRIRNVNFSQNQFQNMASFFYTAGFSVYF